ncbi:MAG: SDR family oxidoreductase [Endozoicomonadaceae bacterium]|nr:SDR family oxidoreductase [Endozoicomonadaceae bacterium]
MNTTSVINRQEFARKHVMISGGTSGINRGIAEHFAEMGACVAVCSRTQSKVDETVSALQAKGAVALGFVADVRNYEQLEQGIKKVAEEWGSIDILIAGAAGNFPALANNMSSNGFRAVIDIDLLGTYHTLRAAFPFLKKPGSSVINISAPQASVPMIAQAHVCAAKAGVDMITRTLALEWGPKGIRVNSIIPGPIQGTEVVDRFFPTEELQKACVDSVPLRRMGTKRDISNACLMLSSSVSSYINGVVLPVDGGWINSGAASIGEKLGTFFTACD